VSLYTTVVHNTAQNSSGNFHSHPSDNHHNSDDVYWRGGVSLDTTAPPPVKNPCWNIQLSQQMMLPTSCT